MGSDFGQKVDVAGERLPQERGEFGLLSSERDGCCQVGVVPQFEREHLDIRAMGVLEVPNLEPCVRAACLQDPALGEFDL